MITETYSKRARNTDPHTSFEAALATADFAESHIGRIHAALRAFGEMNADGIAAKTGLDAVQVNRRLHEMEDSIPALAETTGATAPTLSGRSARVWRAL